MCSRYTNWCGRIERLSNKQRRWRFGKSAFSSTHSSLLGMASGRERDISLFTEGAASDLEGMGTGIALDEKIIGG